MRAAELLPLDAEAHRNLGAALDERGQWEAALVSLQTRARAAAAMTRRAHSMPAMPQRALGRVARGHAAVPGGAEARAAAQYEAHNNLGNAFLELIASSGGGRLLPAGPRAEARRCADTRATWVTRCGASASCMRRLTAGAAAWRSPPGPSMAHNNLGLLILASRRTRRGRGVPTRGLKLNPGYTEAWNSLGDALRDEGARREALACYRRAVELEPRRADSHCKLGDILFDMRRVEEAMASYRQALAAEPRHVPTHCGTGRGIARQLRRPDEAEASCRAALELEPGYAEALSLLGELRADRGPVCRGRGIVPSACSAQTRSSPPPTAASRRTGA